MHLFLSLTLKKKSYDENTDEMMSHINVGSGKDISIKDLAELIKSVTEFQGNIVYNSNKPDGTQRKCIDVSKLASLGWKSETNLAEGLHKTYQWYKLNKDSLK